MTAERAQNLKKVLDAVPSGYLVDAAWLTAHGIDEKVRTFLLSLYDGTPDFDAIERPRAADLPAVRWKLINLEKLKRDNLAKHAEHRAALEALFR